MEKGVNLWTEGTFTPGFLKLLGLPPGDYDPGPPFFTVAYWEPVAWEPVTEWWGYEPGGFRIAIYIVPPNP